MKRLIALLSIILVVQFVYSQTVYEHYSDGVLMFRFDKQTFDNYNFKYQKELAINQIPFIAAMEEKYGITKIERPFFNNPYEHLTRSIRVYFDKINEVDNIIDEIASKKGILYASKVAYYRLMTNDPYYGDMNLPLTGGINYVYGNKWFLDQIEAEAAWAIHQGGGGTKVAVLDNAVYSSHEDLNVVQQCDVTNSNAPNSNPPTNVTDGAEKYEWSHGTHCAGLVGAITNNGTGVASIGYNLDIVGIKAAVDATGQFALTGLSDGLNWILTNATDIKVLNLSLGSEGQNPDDADLIAALYDEDIVVVAAAGNSNVQTVMYPAGYDHVIAVAALQQNDAKSDFSNYGSWIDIAAPGGNNGNAPNPQSPPVEDLNMLLSTTYCTFSDDTIGGLDISGETINGNTIGPDEQYHGMSGTSMACPVTAGLVGLMRDYNPNLTVDEIETCLLSTADDISAQNASYTGQLGAGRINARAAMECVQETMSNTLNAAFTADQTTIIPGGSVNFTDESTGSPTSWEWTFESADTPTSTDQNPANISYSAVGSYDVTLVVSDGTDFDTLTKQDYIIVEDVDPDSLVAMFTESAISIPMGATVDFTDQSTGNPTTWEWAFQGGAPATSVEQNPTGIQYNAAGNYDVRLIVSTGTQTDTLLKTARIEVVDQSTWPEAIFTPVDTTIVMGGVVNFTDLSTNNPTSWDWSFPGSIQGSSTEQHPTGITYNTPGDYMVDLTVDNGEATASTTGMVHVVEPSTSMPTADFVANYTTVVVGNTVDFTSICIGNPFVYQWTFEGATPETSGAVNPAAVLYDSVGVFDVSLLVSNSLGSDIEEKANYIRVIENIGNNPPEVEFTANTRLFQAGTSVLFTDLTEGNPTSWLWEFEGGSPATSTDQNPVVTYNSIGSFNVKLTVSNINGQETLNKTDYIRVYNPFSGGNSYCDTLNNVEYPENTAYPYHLIDVWGYLPGHNGQYVTAYADYHNDYQFSKIHKLMVPVVKAIPGSSNSTVTFNVWEDDDQQPGDEIGSRTVDISYFYPGYFNPVEFYPPVEIDGPVFLGFEISYDVPDTFSVFWSGDRANHNNTVYVMKNDNWHTMPSVFGRYGSLAIQAEACLVGIEDEGLNANSHINIYPNPTTGNVTVMISAIENAAVSFELYDMLGKKMPLEYQKGEDGVYYFDISGNPAGIYYLNTIIDGQPVVKKISLLD